MFLYNWYRTIQLKFHLGESWVSLRIQQRCCLATKCMVTTYCSSSDWLDNKRAETYSTKTAVVCCLEKKTSQCKKQNSCRVKNNKNLNSVMGSIIADSFTFCHDLSRSMLKSSLKSRPNTSHSNRHRVNLLLSNSCSRWYGSSCRGDNRVRPTRGMVAYIFVILWRYLRRQS